MAQTSLTGFWSVSDAEVAAYEVLLGEPLKRYGIDPSLPGAKTARQFGYFTHYEGDVATAIAWLMTHKPAGHDRVFRRSSRR